jgi:hypothetical protein
MVRSSSSAGFRFGGRGVRFGRRHRGTEAEGGAFRLASHEVLRGCGQFQFAFNFHGDHRVDRIGRRRRDSYGRAAFRNVHLERGLTGIGEEVGALDLVRDGHSQLA